MTEVKNTDIDQPTNAAPTEANGQTAEAVTPETVQADTPNGAVPAEENGAAENPAEKMGEEEASAPVAPSDAETIAQLRAELTAAQAKADESFDKLQRTAAEFQNSRRRQEKLLADEIERASAHIVQRLLPVVDDLDLAFQNVPTEVEEPGGAWLDGLRQIQKKLAQVLEDQGVTMIPKEGPFDPSHHEAVSSEPSETVESGHIIQTLRTGYIYKERVLRPALVRVAA